MVNLHARLPFNLHNRNLSATLDPSSSRSASDSLLVSPTSPRYPITYAVSQTHFYSSPLADSRHPSASRSSSVATDPEGTGHRDARDGDEDGEGGGGDTDVDAERNDANNDRTPILNLRLVNPGGVRNRLALATRGRSPLKYSNGGPQGQVGEAAQTVTGVGAGTATATGPQSIPSPSPKSDLLESVTSPSSTVVPVTFTPRNDVRFLSRASGSTALLISTPCSPKWANPKYPSPRPQPRVLKFRRRRPSSSTGRHRPAYQQQPTAY